MPTYRRIEHNRKFARRIWRAEQFAPRWFVEASAVWTPTYKSFLKFWKNCGEIWGLFDGEKLLACVYLEFYSPESVNIHVSVVEKFDRKLMVKFFLSLKRQKQIDGVKSFQGWIFSKNRSLLNIAQDSGFLPTGLRMMFGRINNKEIVWLEVRG